MKMDDWILALENIFKINMYDVLQDNGNISHNKVIDKAEKEYEKYKVIQDRNYVSDFDKLIDITNKYEIK